MLRDEIQLPAPVPLPAPATSVLLDFNTAVLHQDHA